MVEEAIKEQMQGLELFLEQYEQLYALLALIIFSFFAREI